MFGKDQKSSASCFEECHSISEVPGKIVLKSIGLVQYTLKGVAGDAPKEMEGVFEGLLDAARKAGGNSVIKVQLVAGSYQQQGSGWHMSYVVAYGEAVVLQDKASYEALSGSVRAADAARS